MFQFRNDVGSAFRIVGLLKSGIVKCEFTGRLNTLEDELTFTHERVGRLRTRDAARIASPNLDVSAQSLLSDKGRNPWWQEIEEGRSKDH